MRILVNGYNLKQHATGIATFTISALNALAMQKDLLFEVIVSPLVSEDILNRIIKADNVNVKIFGSKRSSVWFFRDLPHYIKHANFDLLWTPTPLLPWGISKHIKKLVTVHDFVSREYRQTMTFAGRLVTRFCEKPTINTADYLWCNSEYTKRKLEEYHPKRKSDYIFVGDAPNDNIQKIEENKMEAESFLKTLGITKKYLLFVGSLEPRKNLSFLLEVFEEWHKTHDMQLVVVGARKWGSTGIAEIVNKSDYPKNDVIFTPFITDLDLCKLYTLANCYISTALNEGFGMPQAEAMQCGCPVVTAHNSAMIEVVEGAGITVKGWNIMDWCKSIEESLANRNRIIARQDERIKKYNWTFIAADLHKVLTQQMN